MYTKLLRTQFFAKLFLLSLYLKPLPNPTNSQFHIFFHNVRISKWLHLIQVLQRMITSSGG